MDAPDWEELVDRVHRELLPRLDVKRVRKHEPVVVRRLPQPWSILGAGNSAAVLTHPRHADLVVKVYAPESTGLDDEREVYRRLEHHPAYSRCLHAGERYLILKRLRGVNLYDCVHRGIPIPEQVIHDVDNALDYARSRGLLPNDVHGRNVIMKDGRGYNGVTSEQRTIASTVPSSGRSGCGSHIPYSTSSARPTDCIVQ